MNKKYIIAGASLVILAIVALAGYWLFFGKSNQLKNKPVIVTNSAPNPAVALTTIQMETPAQEFSADEKPAQIYQSDEKITVATPEKLPESTEFKSFSYDQTVGKMIGVSGSCSDAYYAIVIFRAKDDYRKNPAASVFNQAFECPTDHKFSNGIELKNFNLPSGEYYFLVANQGNKGTWYNPR